ncbi:MAG: hypothetical protein HZB73_03580 [Nitrosarchaeum sp.]|nr:hypothetical protein [Nitrosarchaeum sp.]
MRKSLGDYMLEQSLSGNIKWTQKNPADTEKSKKKKTERKTSPTNIIYTDDKVKPHVEKIFKIEEGTNTESKKEKSGKKFQTSSASNFKIAPGFSRKGR